MYSALVRIIDLSADEEMLKGLIERCERLLGSLAPSLDEGAYDNVYFQASVLLEQYGDGRFSIYFKERFEKLSKKEEEVFK